jgi:small subunit ribosomal protein S18
MSFLGDEKKEQEVVVDVEVTQPSSSEPAAVDSVDGGKELSGAASVASLAGVSVAGSSDGNVKHNVVVDEAAGAREVLLPNTILFNKIAFVQRFQRCPLCAKDAAVLDHRDVKLLSKFLSERGRILPARLTGVCRRHQRQLTKCVKLARTLALLPFASFQD